MPSFTQRLAAIAVFALAGLSATSAEADERPRPRWNRAAIDLIADGSLDELGSFGVDGLVGAASEWQKLGSLPTLTVSRGEVDAIGFDPTGPNANTVRFVPGGHPLAKRALAITVVTSNRRTGEIIDADVVVNGRYAFGDVDAKRDAHPKRHKKEHDDLYDLQNVLTHEVGHLLGLEENYADEAATMYAYSWPYETSKRTLNDSDAEAFGLLYAGWEPPDRAVGDAPSAGCGGATIAAGRVPSQALGLFAGLFAAAVVVRRGRRGKVAAALLVGALGSPSATAAPRADGGVIVRIAAVQDVTSRWQGGLIVSDLRLAAEGPDPMPRTVTVLGGKLGDFEQIVGHTPVPGAGARVAVELARDRNLLETPEVFGVRAVAD